MVSHGSNTFISTYHQRSTVARARLSNQIGFRDAIIAGLDKTRGKLEASWNFLENSSVKFEFQRYGEQLLDILHVGGLLEANGAIVTSGGVKSRTNYCVLKSRDDLSSLRNYEQLVGRLIKRYKHLANTFDVEMRKLFQILNAFDEDGRRALARYTALCLLDSNLSPRALGALAQPDLISEGHALQFLIVLFRVVKTEQGVPQLLQIVKRAGLDCKLMSLMPPSMRSEAQLHNAYVKEDLLEIVKLHQARAGLETRRQLSQQLLDDLNEEIPVADMIRNVRQFMAETVMPECVVIVIMWSVLISLGEWNKRELLVTDQAVNLLKPYCDLLQAFSTELKSQVDLIFKVQEYCSKHHNFNKSFEKLVVLFYRAKVIGDKAVLVWNDIAQSRNCKDSLVMQMSKLVAWIKSNSDPEKRQGPGAIEFRRLLADRRMPAPDQ